MTMEMRNQNSNQLKKAGIKICVSVMTVLALTSSMNAHAATKRENGQVTSVKGFASAGNQSAVTNGSAEQSGTGGDHTPQALFWLIPVVFVAIAWELTSGTTAWCSEPRLPIIDAELAPYLREPVNAERLCKKILELQVVYPDACFEDLKGRYSC